MNRYIVPLLLVLLSFGIYATYVEGTYGEIQEQIKHKQELEAYLAQAANAHAALEELKTRLESFPEGAEAKLAKMVPDEIDKVRFIVDVNALANKFGFKVKSPQVIHESAEGGTTAKYDRHIFTFRVSAPYPIFRDFLLALESSLALRDIASIAFTAEPATPQNLSRCLNPQSTVYDYRVEIISYSLRP